MPNKHNDARRHKFEKAKYRVTNWSDYNDALRKRGDITVWFTDEAINAWVPERVPGQKGRPVEYSELAIECCLMIRQVFSLPLRQTEGFLTSLVRLMSVDIAVPDTAASLNAVSTCGLSDWPQPSPEALTFLSIALASRCTISV